MPSFVASCGVLELDRLAVPAPSYSSRADPGDRLDERGLAGAVVADKRDDLTGVDFEVPSVSASTAPNRFVTPFNSRSG